METTKGAVAQGRGFTPVRRGTSGERFAGVLAAFLLLVGPGCEASLPGADPAVSGAAESTDGVVVSALITGWSDADIGSTGKAGSATLSGTTYTVLGAGADIYGSSDAFHFVWQSLSGDGTVVARVVTQQNTNSQAKAGVMIRESTAAGARNAFMALTPTGGATFQRRTSTGGTTANTAKTGIAAPYWVRLVRAGNVFTASISTDGATWTTVGSATVSMATSALAGLAVSSHKAGTLSTATFTSVAVTPKPANQPPVASFTATPTSGTAPLAVAFDAGASTDADGTIASWAWVFGDGTTGTGKTASHTYSAAGTFTATLTVTDNLGATATATTAITVANAALPAPWTDADIGTVGATGSAGIASGTFSVTGSGADIWGNADAFHFAWQPSSGDGTIVAKVATQQNTNAWAKAGVMIRESTAAGAAHAFMALTPSNGAAFQYRTATNNGSTNVSVGAYAAPYWVRVVRAGSTFTGSISTDGSTWTTVGSTTFTMASSALVGLAVSSHSAGVLSTATFTGVTVTTIAPPPNQLPTASFTATPTTGVAPLAVAFDGSASADPDGTIASWAWTFGDGTSGTGKTAAHTYATAGTYTVTLTVTDNSGGTASKQGTITVNPAGNQPPVANLVATPQAGKAPLAVTFDGSGSTDSDGTVVSWHLDFGDGTSVDASTASHTYSANGHYTATLTVTDNLGLTGSTAKIISVGSDFESLRRVANRALQNGGVVDAPRHTQVYYSVVAYDDGDVVALNAYQSPQLFQFDPTSASLLYRAIHNGQELGNEDDTRWRIRAHKGTTSATSLFFWTDESYQNIDDENAPIVRDTAVFSNRPLQATPGRLPPRQARVCNFIDDPNVGPLRAALDYDQSTGLAIVPIDNGANPTQDDILQFYRVNPTTGAFEGRLQVWEPIPTDTRQNFSFVRADPGRGVVLFEAGNDWQTDKDILYLAQYAPQAGAVSATVTNVQRITALNVVGYAGDDLRHLSDARDAAYVENGGHLYAVIAGGLYPRYQWDSTVFASGLYVFDLGPVAGPYTMAAPIGKVPFAYPVEAVRLVDGHLVASSRGLHVLDAATVIAVRGEKAVARQFEVPLPYPTYEFDTARIGGDNYLFLASGQQGIDIFQLTGNGTGTMTGAILDTARAVTLELGAGNLLLETGGGLRHLGPPVMNDAGTIAAWGVTDNNREVILRKVKGQATQVVAAASDAGWASFGRPSINVNGDLAFWAGSAAGADAILLYSGGTLATAVQSGSSLPFLFQPELADDGSMVFLGQTADGRNNVFVRKSGGATTTVATDNSTEALGLDGYDLSPDGLVVYNGVTWNAPDVLHLWNGTSASTLFSLTQEQGYVRFGPGNVTMRTWDGEIVRLYRISTAGVATLIARHGDANNFGDFLSSRSNAAGDVVFEAVHWLTPTSSPSEMGNWLHRCLASVGNPNPVVTRPLDTVDGRTQVDLDFVDAFNASGAIGFTLTLQDSASVVRQAVIGYNYPLP